MKNYPLTLPYSRSLVTINNLLAEYIDNLMDYWQFLLTDISEFTQVAASCEQLLLTARDQIMDHI